MRKVICCLEGDIRIFQLIVLALSILTVSSAQSQELDVFVDAHGDRLHFHILKGHGIPILFEAGGGDDSTVWGKIEQPIHAITGATLITYDRAGFGQSDLNAKEREISGHGILNGVEELEVALKQLGYSGDVMLVAHSYGALYATLYAARHPDSVKAAVLIDGSSACWFDDAWMKTFILERKDRPSSTEKPGSFYQSENLPDTVTLVRERPFPLTIPVIDIVSEFPPFSSENDISRWKNCHRQFANAQPNRQAITAHGTGHYIYRDNPPLVIDSVVKAYTGIVDRKAAFDILRREVDYAIEAANEIGQRTGASHR